MDHQEIAISVRHEYKVSMKGSIKNSGKFEGDPIWVPYFWELGLLGFADNENNNIFKFAISYTDRELFPEIPRQRRTISVWEDEQGFCRYI